MAEEIISFIPENDKEFKALLDKYSDKISDFRIPFGLIVNHWYRGNKKIFSLKGPGLYEDLSPNYKKYKKKDVRFVYPILKRKGRLEKSLTSKNDTDAEYFVGRNSLVMGTKVPYAKYHQSDEPRKSLPQRKMIFIDGGPAERSKDALISGRLQAWTNIINDYVSQVLDGKIK